jgi:pyroglutamyl-peptidase
MRLLLTGFEPFNGESVNPSAEVVRAIETDPPTGIQLTTMILPVRFRSVAERILPALDGGAHDAWLGLGEAGKRAQLSVERVGINVFVDAALPVADRVEHTIREGGPDAYFARLPLHDLAATMREAGAPSVVSNTAGTYCCNESIYTVGHHLTETGRDLLAGFIHLPYLPEQTTTKPVGTASMALDTQLRGIRAAIELLRDHVAARAPELART